ncbi:NTP transferase domain-containing protein [Acidilobus sp.]|jgi:adenosylcobinamide-phosphate guanylyltransferase|uniref:NTP transferase domain-containing protein n=1 Tax=Acidilobus sp. TaxID=1872109 RepID=UPI003D000DE4
MIEVAAIMAGGLGSRLGGPWKPTVNVCGRPLIRYVIDAVSPVSRLALIVTSPASSSYLRGLALPPSFAELMLDGSGYGYDLGRLLNVVRPRPLLVLPADLYGLRSRDLEEAYRVSLEVSEPVVTVRARGEYVGISVFKGYSYDEWANVDIDMDVINVNDGESLEEARSRCE